MRRTEIEVDAQAQRTCPSCDELLGAGRWEGAGLVLPDPVTEALTQPARWSRIEICPFCKILREWRNEDPKASGEAGGASECRWCGGSSEERTLESRRLEINLEETLAKLHLETGARFRQCGACGGLSLPDGSMELRGLEVALQRDGIRQGIGIWLWRGFLAGGALGAVFAALRWEWSALGELAILALGGAIVGAGLGGVLAPLLSLGWGLLQGSGRQRLS